MLSKILYIIFAYMASDILTSLLGVSNGDRVKTTFKTTFILKTIHIFSFKELKFYFLYFEIVTKINLIKLSCTMSNKWLIFRHQVNFLYVAILKVNRYLGHQDNQLSHISELVSNWKFNKNDTIFGCLWRYKSGCHMIKS